MAKNTKKVAKPAKAAKAKPKASKPKRSETRRTKAPTLSDRQETPRTRAATAMDVRSQTRRTRAATVSDRAENPRTRAPTGRHAGVPPARRPRTDTARDGETPTRAGTGRSRRDTTLDGVPPQTEMRFDQDEVTAGDPSRASELEALEQRVNASNDPDLLVAIASQIDTLGMQLAFEISRHAHDEAHIAPLKPVLMHVPTSYGRALIRAAEKYDDLGSPKRAVYVLFEALRKAFDADLIMAVSEALSFMLEAHGQGAAARQLRALVATRAAQRASGVDRKEVRTQFGASLAQLRDRGLDWTALADEPPPFD